MTIGLVTLAYDSAASIYDGGTSSEPTESCRKPTINMTKAMDPF